MLPGYSAKCSIKTGVLTNSATLAVAKQKFYYQKNYIFHKFHTRLGDKLFYNFILFLLISYKGIIIRSDKIELHPLTKVIDAQNYFMEYVY
jgi:hypothetical protein